MIITHNLTRDEFNSMLSRERDEFSPMLLAIILHIADIAFASADSIGAKLCNIILVAAGNNKNNKIAAIKALREYVTESADADMQQHLASFGRHITLGPTEANPRARGYIGLADAKYYVQDVLENRI